MTRKKFIKMLMHAGMPRNDAADCATLAQEAGRDYNRVCGDLLNFHRRDFGNPLAWMKMRGTIIHGYGTPPTRFYAGIDEAHTHATPAINAILTQGMAAKPRPVVITMAAPNEDFLALLDEIWPPQPQPVAGALIAAPAAPEETASGQWPKVNPHISADALDAICYAVETVQRMQRGGLLV